MGGSASNTECAVADRAEGRGATRRREIVRRVMPKRMPTALQDLNPVLARVLAVRGIQHAEDIGHELDALHRPTQAGLARATAILADVVMTGRRLTIIGDFDADGATSTALA
ncbi:MAG: hypothetical protein P8104_02650, partial [Gammaproteobacteria bacterium]